MEITKEQVLDIYNMSQSEAIRRFLEFNFREAFKVQLEVDKVYKLRDMLIKFQGDEKAYGFSDGIWFNNKGWELSENKYDWKEATTAEWHDALIAEAKKRGYKNGNYECLYMPHLTEEVSNDFFIDIQELWTGDLNTGNMIFKDGVWAEIVKTFSKEEAEKLLGGKII